MDAREASWKSRFGFLALGLFGWSQFLFELTIIIAMHYGYDTGGGKGPLDPGGPVNVISVLGILISPVLLIVYGLGVYRLVRRGGRRAVLPAILLLGPGIIISLALTAHMVNVMILGHHTPADELFFGSRCGN